MADIDQRENQPIAIKVQDVSKSFKLPHERSSSIKSLLLNLFRSNSYETQQALHDVSFEVRQGDFFGIVGRNGSGKSTLLKMLAGIYTPTKGHVHVSGKLTPFIELGVGFNPELTGRENVFLNGALLGFTRKEMLAMYDDIVDFAEIERFMDQKLKNYSSGMQVRLAFSIAIRARGDILLLDEVLAVGDTAFQQKCYNYFEELKAQKKTVVFVSHDMGAIRRFCTRAVYIRDGNLIMEGTPSEVADEYSIDNLESAQAAKNKEEPAGPKLYTLAAKIIEQSHDNVTFKLSYKSKEDEPMYAAISLLRDGISIAEITTALDRPLQGSGDVTYTLDTTILNGGMYELTAVLCRLKNRELLAIGRGKNRFVIKGSDLTKGASLKLADNWKY